MRGETLKIKLVMNADFVGPLQSAAPSATAVSEIDDRQASFGPID
jgi:hypothetical protein